MNYIINILIAIVAFEHLYFLWLEMFAWTTKAKKVFKQFPEELFEPTKTLAANQGLYNGFLSAGLIWSLLIQDQNWSTNVSLFFLSCVAIAGIYGAFTASKKIFVVQALPALITIVLIIVRTFIGS
jgi:putative membrane protein